MASLILSLPLAITILINAATITNNIQLTCDIRKRLSVNTGWRWVLPVPTPAFHELSVTVERCQGLRPPNPGAGTGTTPPVTGYMRIHARVLFTKDAPPSSL
jgi:hypothetical protein